MTDPDTTSAPPPGWFPLGWHAEHRPTEPGTEPIRLVLSWTHLGPDGMPLWEIPIETGDPALFPASYATPTPEGNDPSCASQTSSRES